MKKTTYVILIKASYSYQRWKWFWTCIGSSFEHYLSKNGCKQYAEKLLCENEVLSNNRHWNICVCLWVWTLKDECTQFCAVSFKLRKQKKNSKSLKSKNSTLLGVDETDCKIYISRSMISTFDLKHMF